MMKKKKKHDTPIPNNNLYLKCISQVTSNFTIEPFFVYAQCAWAVQTQNGSLWSSESENTFAKKKNPLRETLIHLKIKQLVVDKVYLL